MKSLISFIMICFCFALTGDAQRAITLTNSADTVANTGTVNLTITIPSAYGTATFQVVNTKISGTVAGNSLLQASNDGVNYITLDTLVNTNQTTNTKIFEQSPPKYRHYRIRSTGSGTMAYKTYGYAVLKS
jgi:hypothetical protein